MAAGRTDLGVHARMQVLSMRLVEDIPVTQFAARVNAQLTLPTGVVMAVPANRKFNAGYSAVGKEYRYRLISPEGLKASPTWAPWAWETAVDVEKLKEALALFPGTRNYIAFSQKTDPADRRTVHAIDVHALPGGVTDIRVHGTGFAKYMVRYIVSAAVLYAQGQVTLERIATALETGVHLKADKAPPHGLVMWQVKYPPELDPFSEEERASPPLPQGLPFFV